MKQFVILLLLAMPAMGWGQVSNGKDVGADKTLHYITVTVADMSKYSAKKVEAKFLAGINYGQDISTDSPMKIKPTPELGENDMSKKNFVSLLEIFNYMAGFGWEYVQTMPRANQYDLTTAYMFRRE